MKKRFFSLFIIFGLFFGFISLVHAEESVLAGFAGPSYAGLGEEVSFDININNVNGSSDGKLYAYGGYIYYDSQYLEFVSFNGINAFQGNYRVLDKNKVKISLIDFTMSNGVSSGKIGTVTFRTIKTGNTSVTMNDIEATDQEKNLDVSFYQKLLAINTSQGEESDNNCNLSNLYIEGYELFPAFSNNVKTYYAYVPSSTMSLNVFAEAEDSRATVIGSGTINLSSKTKITNIIVTAEDGSISVYDIVINKSLVTLDQNNITITGLSNKIYTGKYITQNINVVYDGKTLVLGKDYKISYSNNKNVGTALVTIEGTGSYVGKISYSFKINKANNPLAVTTKLKSVKYTKVKKKKQVVAPITVTKKQGVVTFIKQKGSSSKLSINKTTGKITVKKGTKKGTYKIIVKINATGNANYNAKYLIKTIKVKVK